MLTKLVNESDSKFVAVHEEIAGGNVPLEELHGIAACQTDDVLSRNWHGECGVVTEVIFLYHCPNCPSCSANGI